MPTTRPFGNPVTVLTTHVITSSGFVMTTTTASGACCLMPSAAALAISTFFLRRSIRSMPGFLGKPAVTTTTSAPRMTSMLVRALDARVEVEDLAGLRHVERLACRHAGEDVVERDVGDVPRRELPRGRGADVAAADDCYLAHDGSPRARGPAARSRQDRAPARRRLRMDGRARDGRRFRAAVDAPIAVPVPDPGPRPRPPDRPPLPRRHRRRAAAQELGEEGLGLRVLREIGLEPGEGRLDEARLLGGDEIAPRLERLQLGDRLRDRPATRGRSCSPRCAGSRTRSPCLRAC